MTLRAGTRALTFASRRVAYQQARTVAPKRFSSSAHSAPQSGDKPWMVRPWRLFFPVVKLELNPRVRCSFRLALRSSSFRRSAFRDSQRVTCTLTMEALHSIDDLSVVTFCALKATSRSHRYRSWRAPCSCCERPRNAPSTRTSRAYQGMAPL